MRREEGKEGERERGMEGMRSGKVERREEGVGRGGIVDSGTCY